MQMNQFSGPRIVVFGLLAFALFYPSLTWAQSADDDDQEIQGVESELEKNLPARTSVQNFERTEKKKKDTLEYAAPVDGQVNDIVVIQKNYMPKTGRFAVSGGLTLFPSDVFFKTFGANVRGGYFFNETWGVELNGLALVSTKSVELQDLESKQGVTANLITALKSYIGGQIYFCNMYGKYALDDRKIFPFEIYQTVGIGQVTSNNSSSVAVNLGLGQLLSLSRNSSLRFDISVLLYQAETITASKQSATSILVSLSYNTFFPKVGSRW